MVAARYRPDIDGLRTIAVTSVILFHVGIPGFSGGFTGVDVFFVISGFLITRLIADELAETGEFSFSRFYVRRIRRLFPALLSTCAASLILATLLFSPEHMERFARSVPQALLSVSNFHFWGQADYFDTDALTKPLLHTWSLAVEEQFYLIWPAALVVLLTRTRLPVMAGVLALATLASLVIARVWLKTDPSAAFYLLPARIAEFMVGAAIVWLSRARPVPTGMADGLLLTGLAMIALAVALFTPDMPFPGVAALLPCVGAAIAIYAGSARVAGMLLCSAPVVAIGRWSYSIYLVHWPLLVFYAAYTYAEPNAAEKAALVVLSIVLGWLQYRLVEETFRHESRGRVSRPQFALAAAGLATLLIVPAAAIWSSHGWTERIPADRVMLTSRDSRVLETKTYCSARDPSKPENLFTCQNFRGKTRDIILWGDSHARHLVAGFSQLYPEHNIFVAYLSACVPQSGIGGFVHSYPEQSKTDACVERNRQALAFLKSYRRSTIVVSNSKRGDPETMAGPTKEILAELVAAGHNAFVLGDFIRPGRHLVNCASVPGWLISDAHIKLRCTGLPDKMQEELAYNERLDGLLDGFINPNHFHCPGGRCVHLDGSTVLYRDDHHLSPEGAVFLLSRLKAHLPIDHGRRVSAIPRS